MEINRERKIVVMDKDSQKEPSSIKTVTFNDLTWVDIVHPTREATNYLAEHYDFHPLDLDDCLSRRQLSKIDEYPQYLFIIFHFPVYDKKRRVSERRQWSAFVGDKFVVTLRPGELKSLDALFRQCELSVESRQENMSQGSGYLMYRILDRAVDSYFPVLDKIMSLLEDVEDSVFSEEVEVAQELSILRRDIITQRQVMFPTRVLLLELEKKLKRFTKIDLTIYYSDLMDHMNRICETLDDSKETIEIFKDADYLLSSYHGNRGIRVQTIMLAIVLPLLVVFGLYGMYVFLCGGIGKVSLQTFSLLLVIVFIIIGLMLYFFHRRNLI